MITFDANPDTWRGRILGWFARLLGVGTLEPVGPAASHVRCSKCRRRWANGEDGMCSFCRGPVSHRGA